VLPTPRYGNLNRWVAQELEAAGVTVRGDVAGALVDLFGEDLPGIAGEVAKLELLDGAITPERARAIAHRPAARSAFDLTDAIAAGDVATALRNARSLLEVGEAPVRVMAVLAWQIDLVVRCAALALRDPEVTPEAAARELKSSPYPTKKALGVARGLDEPALADLVGRTVAADVAMKTGRDPAWALESVVIDLAGQFARRAPPRAARRARAAAGGPRPGPRASAERPVARERRGRGLGARRIGLDPVRRAWRARRRVAHGAPGEPGGALGGADLGDRAVGPDGATHRRREGVGHDAQPQVGGGAAAGGQPALGSRQRRHDVSASRSEKATPSSTARTTCPSVVASDRPWNDPRRSGRRCGVRSPAR
jgi:hypothetical protein